MIFKGISPFKELLVTPMSKYVGLLVLLGKCLFFSFEEEEKQHMKETLQNILQ